MGLCQFEPSLRPVSDRFGLYMFMCLLEATQSGIFKGANWILFVIDMETPPVS